jgi:iron complex outermembrane receptor protein
MRRSFSLALLLSGIAPAALHAQTAPAPAPAPSPTPAPQSDDPISDEPDIIVTGSRNLPGSVIGDIPPEQQLGPADIRSYGVSSVSDLLTELAPQTTSGRGGAPVVLLNGRRISSFAEIRDLPTEAIARVDILPEEVALKYGYRADQKVVNFVLRRRFRALTVEVGDKLATDGGRNTPNATLDILNIKRDTRFSVHTGYTQSSALLESERDIAPIAGNTLDQRDFRTLLPFTRTLNLGTVYAQPIGKVSTTLNGTVAYTESNGLQGFSISNPSSSFVIGQRNTAMTYHLGGTANGDFSSIWRWSLTSNYDRVDSQTFTDADTVTPGVPAANRGFSTSNSGEVNALVNGKLFKLPAGDISAAIRVGGSLSRLDSRSLRFGTYQSGSITRNVANGQINVDVPIASKSKDVLAFIGDLSLNGNFALDNVSDFGTLKTIGYGLNWSPIKAVRVIASMIDEDDAPSASQLGAPVIVTPNVRVFDYVTGQTVTVSQTSGGNPFLIADSKHSFKLGLTIKPLDKTDLTLTANYVSTSVRNATASFPAATAAIETAFPSRFTRVNGTLTAIDARPVNFARTESSQLRWGINFSQPLKSKLQKQIEAFRAGTGPDPRPALAGLRNLGNSQSVFGGTLARGFRGQNGPGGQNNPPPPTGGTPPADGAPPPAGTTGGGPGGPGGGGFGGRGGGGGGRFGGGGPGGGGGRLNFAFYHTWHFTDRVEIAPSVPVIDLLNGGAIGSGGQSRHELEGQFGYSNNGIGARLSVNWQSGTRVVGGTAATPNTLNFSSLATANLRLFFDPTTRLDLIAKHKWLMGTRFVVSVDNLFDTRQRVRDAAGNTPVSYQPDYLDPLGRTIRIGIRKLLF